MSTAPAHLQSDERTVYTMAADRSRMSYRRRNGGNVRMSLAERRTWSAEHAERLAAAADRGGMSAVRKMHAARVAELVTMSDPDRIGGPATGEYLARITAAAERSEARLAALAPVSTRAPRKRPAPVAAPVAVVVDEAPAAPVADVVELRPAPDTVPAPMPAMTRAARKATRREIAAAMRAEGLRPEGEEWRRRCAAAGLPVAREDVNA